MTQYTLQRKASDGSWLTMRDSLGPYRFITVNDALWHRKLWASDAIHTSDYRVIDETTGEEVA